LHRFIINNRQIEDRVPPKLKRPSWFTNALQRFLPVYGGPIWF